MKFGQLILRNNIRTVCHQMSDFKAKMHQSRFRLGLRPRPHWGAYSAPPDLIVGLRGPTSKRRGGREETRKGGKGREGGGTRGGEERREGDTKGSFPAGTPGNGVPKVILTVGTAFPGTQ